jgi:hypothetical protein
MLHGLKRLFPTTACLVLSGCVFGENKQFFESSAGTLASAYTNPDVISPDASPTPTATPDVSAAPTASPTPLASATPAPVPSATPATVCNPFGSGATAQAGDGIQGQMYYFNPNEISTYAPGVAQDFYDHGHLANANFYFNDFDVPTRAFDQGFQLDDGSLLATNDGTKLFENFAFKFKTSIQLPVGAGTKLKQFAIMSDDGSKLIVQDPTTQVWNEIVNDDGIHASRLTCAGLPVQVGSDFSTPIELQYFQGPRYHIALVLLWRDWDGNNQSDPWCGQSGNNLFFDSSTLPSTAQAPWLDLMTRWEVVPSSVFHLDAGNVNPCH